MVDGPNVVNDVTRLFPKNSLGEDGFASELREYITRWFDVDRLVRATVGDDWGDGSLGIVIFHSKKSIGAWRYERKGQDDDHPCVVDAATWQRCANPSPVNPRKQRVPLISGDKNVTAFWARQGACPHTSTRLVDVPLSRSGKETGVDIAIVAYLFDTVDSWDEAIIFTTDADYVPAIWSLRHRGKRVMCASPSDGYEKPLVQAAQHFFHWNTTFVVQDLMMLRILQPGGSLDQVLDHAAVKKAHYRVNAQSELMWLQQGGTDVEQEDRQAAADALKALFPLAQQIAVGAWDFQFGKRLTMEGFWRHWTLIQEAGWFRANSVDLLRKIIGPQGV